MDQIWTSKHLYSSEYLECGKIISSYILMAIKMTTRLTLKLRTEIRVHLHVMEAPFTYLYHSTSILKRKPLDIQVLGIPLSAPN